MIDLKTAKYKGVEFLFDDMPTTGGNRLIKFNYPGSDEQSIERQGKAPRTFNITAIIPHENYYQKRDNLLRVLEDGEPGVLTHPTFGDIENVINGLWSLDEKITELGRATISISFEIDGAIGIPQQSSELISITEQLNTDFQDVIDFYLRDTFNVSLRFPENFTDSFNQLTDVTELFDSSTKIATPITEQSTQFKSQLRSFESNINDLIKDPLQLSSDISGLYDSVNNLYENPSDTLSVFTAMFNFGDNDPLIKLTTASRIERKINRDVIREAIQSKALSNAYMAAGEITYNTTQDIDDAHETLENQYEKIRNFT